MTWTSRHSERWRSNFIFAGTALIVSHDRWFLDRVATHIIAFEGDSHLEMISCLHSDYESDRKKRLGDLEPTRSSTSQSVVSALAKTQTLNRLRQILAAKISIPT